MSLRSVRLALALIALGLFIPLGFLPFAKGWDSRSSWIENIQDSEVCFKGDVYGHVFVEMNFPPPSQPSRRKPDDEFAGLGTPVSPPTGAVGKATKLPSYEKLTAEEFLDAPARSVSGRTPNAVYDVEKIANGKIVLRDQFSRYRIFGDGTIIEEFPEVDKAHLTKDGFDAVSDEMGTFAIFEPRTPPETRKVAVQSASLPEAPSGQRRIWRYEDFKIVKPGIFLPFSVIMLSGTIMAFFGTIILIFAFGRRRSVEKTQ